MRLLFQLISQCALGAIALIIVHFALPGVSLSVNGFFAAIGVFTLAHMILGPFVLSVALHYAAPLAGGVGLVATLLALWIASMVPDGIAISGVGSWILAPIIVWVITALGGWIFMALVIDKWIKRRNAEKLVRSVQKA